MKKWFFLLMATSTFFFGACKKDKNSVCTAVESTAVATAAEIDSIQHYLTANGLVAQQHVSGAFYTIDSAGTGKSPAICNSVAVTYTGNIFNNPVPFDSFTDSIGVSLAMPDLIAGWQRVMPVLKVGGRITIYIPPSLGYGSVDKKNKDGDIQIPKNSYLKFTVHLLEVY